jgi:hypothetical protein
MKRITRIVAAAALALAFAAMGVADAAGAQDMEHGIRQPSALDR